MGQSTWGLISRVSSRTYRECQTLIHEHVQPSTCSQPSRHANYGPIPRSTTSQDSQPNVSKRSLPKWCPIRRHYEPLLRNRWHYPFDPQRHQRYIRRDPKHRNVRRNERLPNQRRLQELGRINNSFYRSNKLFLNKNIS